MNNTTQNRPTKLPNTGKRLTNSKQFPSIGIVDGIVKVLTCSSV